MHPSWDRRSNVSPLPEPHGLFETHPTVSGEATPGLWSPGCPPTGPSPHIALAALVDGVSLRDRVWLDLRLDDNVG
jgi:hypothetical protein